MELKFLICKIGVYIIEDDTEMWFLKKDKKYEIIKQYIDEDGHDWYHIIDEERDEVSYTTNTEYEYDGLYVWDYFYKQKELRTKKLNTII